MALSIYRSVRYHALMMGTGRGPNFHSAIVAAIAGVVFLLAGCQPQGATGGDGLTAAGTDNRTSWTIVLDGYEGTDHQAMAQQRAGAFTLATGMNGFWVSHSAAKSEVNFGRYATADAPQVKTDIERLRAFSRQGRIQPRMMAVVPALTAASGPYAQWELRNARQPDMVYSLVIEQFTPAMGAGYRQAAEKAAADLRAQSIEAYYYHGPRESVVTLGQFSNAAAHIVASGPNAGQVEYHPFIRDTLQKKYPFALVNGQPANPPTPTFLIRIPD